MAYIKTVQFTDLVPEFSSVQIINPILIHPSEPAPLVLTVDPDTLLADVNKEYGSDTEQLYVRYQIDVSTAYNGRTYSRVFTQVANIIECVDDSTFHDEYHSEHHE